jgi:hypothetical protein
MCNWSPVHEELDYWSTVGKTASFWWRDDDAIEDTPQLGRLLRLSDATGTPLTLAVIPTYAVNELAEQTEDRGHISIAVHGYSHQNYAPKTEKKRELGLHRESQIVLSELSQGFTKLEAMFPNGFIKALVPPWNRIDHQLVEQLPRLGFSSLSTFQPRQSKYAAPGLPQVNCHIDPIEWHGTRSLVPSDVLVEQTRSLLERQRLGLIDAEEPLGLLTHHLVHDDAIWDFTESFVKLVQNHPASQFVIGLERPSD